MCKSARPHMHVSLERTGHFVEALDELVRAQADNLALHIHVPALSQRAGAQLAIGQPRPVPAGLIEAVQAVTQPPQLCDLSFECERDAGQRRKPLFGKLPQQLIVTIAEGPQ